MPVSSLSEIINGKRPLTKKYRDKIGKALKMSEEQINAFNGKNHGNSLKDPQDQLTDDYRQLALDSFYIISEWFHYGILQLIKIKGFKNNSHWIAKRLGILPSQAEIAVERLLRIGILQEVDGKLIDITGGNTSHLKSDFTNEQLRGFQVQALEKAIVALKTVPIAKRDNTSMTLAVSREAIPFAKEEIKKFRRKLTKKLESFGEPDEVYQLAISLTPLTNLENIQEN